MNGFRGLLSLVDEQSGKAMTITRWESRHCDTVSKPQLALRTTTAQILTSHIVDAGRFEVVLDATGAGAV